MALRGRLRLRLSSPHQIPPNQPALTSKHTLANPPPLQIRHLHQHPHCIPSERCTLVITSTNTSTPNASVRRSTNPQLGISISLFTISPLTSYSSCVCVGEDERMNGYADVEVSLGWRDGSDEPLGLDRGRRGGLGVEYSVWLFLSSCHVLAFRPRVEAAAAGEVEAEHPH